MITIFLRKITGKGEKLQISQKSNVKDLLSQIFKVFNNANNENEGGEPSIACFHRGTRLQDNLQDLIEDVGISANSIIHVVQTPKDKDEQDDSASICLKLIIKSKPFEYEITNDSKIKDLKQQICSDLQIKEEDLTLSYLGIELDDKKTIKEHELCSEVLLSASVNAEIDSQKFNQRHSVSKESYSQDSESIPKIIRKNSTPLKNIKKAESMNVQANVDFKSKNIDFSSVRLKKIEEKNDDESKIQSQINQSQENSEIQEETPKIEKPKLTLDFLSKPWYGDQKVIQTESIVGDEESDQIFTECLAEFTRTDKKRQYVLECCVNHTFEDAQEALARLQRLQKTNIRLILNFDEVSKSGISSRSTKRIQSSSPRSSESLKRQRSSNEGGRLSVYNRNESLKTKIVERAAKLKSRMITVQYEHLVLQI